jgi:hypothetical protein
VGLAPTGKRRLFTAHAETGRSPRHYRADKIAPDPNPTVEESATQSAMPVVNRRRQDPLRSTSFIVSRFFMRSYSLVVSRLKLTG